MVQFRAVVPTTTPRALLWGFVVSIVAFALLLLSGFGSGIWGLTEIAPRFAPPAPDDSIWTLVGTLITVGTPVVLYLRIGLLSPLVVLVAEFLAWSLGTGAVWYFAVFFWPIYLILFLLFGGIEYLLRTRSVLPSLPTA